MANSKLDIFDSIHNSEDEKVGANMRGEFGESAIKLVFIQLGFRVSDAANNYPYDFIVERHNKMYRVQAKTARNGITVNFKASDHFDLAAILAGDGSLYVIPREGMSFTSGGTDKSRLKFRLTKVCRSTFKVATVKPAQLEPCIEAYAGHAGWPQGGPQ